LTLDSLSNRDAGSSGARWGLSPPQILSVGFWEDSAMTPQWIEPELCKLVTRIPAGGNWAHEIKFDGFRMHARIVSGAAAPLTRNGLDWTAKYPDVAAAIGALNCRQAYPCHAISSG
jgi:hypothetical protein